MSQRALLAIVVLFVLCGLSACKQNEKQGKTVAGNKKSAIVPGEMVLIPAGEFIMGTDNKEDVFANPQHKVSLPAFRIEKYEVTNGQFLDYTIKSGYQGEGHWRDYFTPDKAEFPVVSVSWEDANSYCKSVGKRLPTEEEWEKAARGPDGNAYPWGNEWKDNQSNTFESGLKNPAAIGQFNDVGPYGVHDMLGNVQEWTSSGFDIYKGNPRSKELMAVLTEKRFVVRGISARIPGKKGHLWNRSGFRRTDLYDTGFRCAQDATPEEAAKAGK
jgi:formylglycine-generating enzyme required for sulfatase activity